MKVNIINIYFLVAIASIEKALSTQVSESIVRSLKVAKSKDEILVLNGSKDGGMILSFQGVSIFLTDRHMDFNDCTGCPK